MNKILQKLTIIANSEDAEINGCNLKIGNYRVKRTNEMIIHYYYGNIIAKVYWWTKKCYLYDCGYKKYRLTTAQLNFLTKYYKNKRYIIIYE